MPPPGAAELVVWLAANERPGRRPADIALLAFAAGLAVPEVTVRSAFTAAITGIKLPVEAAMPQHPRLGAHHQPPPRHQLGRARRRHRRAPPAPAGIAADVRREQSRPAPALELAASDADAALAGVLDQLLVGLARR